MRSIELYMPVSHGDLAARKFSASYASLMCWWRNPGALQTQFDLSGGARSPIRVSEKNKGA